MHCVKRSSMLQSGNPFVSRSIGFRLISRSVGCLAGKVSTFDWYSGDIRTALTSFAWMRASSTIQNAMY